MPRIKSALRGALRGLDPHRDIIIDNTADTIEVGSGDEVDNNKTKRGTRSRRHSGGHVVNYDQKYHPMDAVTRPNSRRTRRHVPDSSQTLDLSSDDDSDSSLSSAIDVDSEEEEESEDELASDPPVYITPRAPNPGAVRHSSRAEARKPVNYSKKFHPQDVGIPGYQHKARHFALVQPTPASGTQSKSKKRRSASPAEEEDSAPRRPRKHLRSLHSTEEPPRKAVEPVKRGRGRPRKKPVTPESDIDEAVLLADWACVSTQRRKRSPTPLPDNPDDIAMDAIRALPSATQRAALQSRRAEADDPASDSGVNIPSPIAKATQKAVCPDSDSDNESISEEPYDPEATEINIHDTNDNRSTKDDSTNDAGSSDVGTNNEVTEDGTTNDKVTGDEVSTVEVNDVETDSEEMDTDDMMGILQDPDHKNTIRPASRETVRSLSGTMSGTEEQQMVQEEEDEVEQGFMPSFANLRSQFEEQMAGRSTNDDEAAKDETLSVEINSAAKSGAGVSSIDMRGFLRYHVEPDKNGTPRPASPENRRLPRFTISEDEEQEVGQQEEEDEGEQNCMPSFGRMNSEFEEQMAMLHPQYSIPMGELHDDAQAKSQELVQGEPQEGVLEEVREEPEEELEEEPFEGCYPPSSDEL